MSDDIRLDTKALKKLIASLEDVPYAKVGVLGGKNARKTGEAENNASIGLKHEFGKDGMPERSFLRVPLTNNMQNYLEKADAFGEESFAKIVAEGSWYGFVVKLGLIGENIVGDAFKSGGFGLWKPSNMKYKKVKQTLIETQQLRNSITSEVTQ